MILNVPTSADFEAIILSAIRRSDRRAQRSLTDDPRPAKLAQAPSHQTRLAGNPPGGQSGAVGLRGAPTAPPRPAGHVPTEPGGGHGAESPGPRPTDRGRGPQARPGDRALPA